MLFIETAKATGAAELTAKWMINDLPRALAGKELASAGLEPLRFVELMMLVQSRELTASAAKTVLADMIATGKHARELATARATPASDLRATVEAVITANSEKAAEYKAGRTGLLGFFVGQVMKATPNADPAAVNRAVRERLG
jgi:glutaminyl-tRNA synthetase